MELERSDVERIVRLVIAELMRLAGTESGPGRASARCQGGALPSSEAPSFPPAGSRNALVLYSGTSAGLGTVFAQLRTLEEQGYTLTHVLPSQAAGVLQEEQIRRALNVPSERMLAGPAAEMVTVEEKHEAVIAATLNCAEAAKVALAQTDTPFSSLVCQALWKGRPVVVARDGARTAGPPANPGPAALVATVEEHLQKLATYGARVVAAAELAAAVQAAVSDESTNRRVHELTKPREVITAQDLEETMGEVVVRPNAIITPLAWDVARKRGISIRREAE